MRQKMGFMWQQVMTSSVAGSRRSSKILPKVKLAPKKGHDHWWSAAHLIHYNFLNLGETVTYEKYTQQINEMHQKLQCLQPALVNRKGPILLHDNTQLHVTTNASLVEWIGLQSFSSFTLFTWPLINHLPLFPASQQLFAEKILLQQVGGRKCFPRVCQIPKHSFFMLQE